MKLNVFGKHIEVKTEFVIFAGAALILLGCLAGYLFFRDNSDIIIENSASDLTKGSQSQTRTISETSAAITESLSVTTGPSVMETEQIKVYVVGCVKKPGIVTLNKGQVIDDAVRMAGGLTEEADASNINMVYKLNENTMLYIKSIKELASTPDDALKKSVKNTATISNDTKVNETGNLGKGAEIFKDSGDSVEMKGSGDGSSLEGSGAQESAIININTADTAELDKLPGVGEATASEIISYREKNGPFRKIEDIMKVPRIKQGRFDSIKDLICVN